jgi:hypothetical protein
MEEMLWIEDIIESTQAPPFLTNFKVGLVGFVELHKVGVGSNAFLALPNA